MNHHYRLIWSAAAACWQAVPETARGRGKSVTVKPATVALALTLIGASFAPFTADAGPQGGRVSAGSATISQAGATTTINQTTAKAAIDWSSFSVGKTEVVRFNQPGASAITLNRVTGTESSQILGNLSANGQVFILNPNGVLFGQGAQVNVGGMVASTLGMSNADFMAGNFKFTGTGSGSVVNQGNIAVAEGGTLALIAPVVQNTGTLSAPQGSVLLAAADAVTLKLQDGSLVAYTLDKGSLQALIDNGGLIQAAGGHVVLTAKGQDAMSRATVNHSGVIEAQTVSSKNGVVELLGDMAVGQVNLSGKIDASAPNGGDGGFVETSAATVKITDTAQVSTSAARGKTGTWLIDPVDFTIAASGGNITGSVLGTLLGSNSITIHTATGANTPTNLYGTTGTNGDIFVNDGVSWSANTTLTLNAYRNIEINAPIVGSGTSSGVALNPGQGGSGDYRLAGSITLPGSTATFSVNGASYTLIHDISQLQGMGLSGNYALAQDIDASVTAGWNAGAGFVPIGSYPNAFYGIFDGLGHTVTALTINRPTTSYVGLFGYTYGSTIQNVGLEAGSVIGGPATGMLVGEDQGTVRTSYSTGNVTGVQAGGLLGTHGLGTVSNSYSTANVTVTSSNEAGGLIGYLWSGSGAITNSYATGTVSRSSSPSTADLGGLIGKNASGVPVVNSYWDTQTSGRATSAGGTGKTTAEMKQQATFSGWDFTNTWRIVEGSSYPLLRALTQGTLVINAQARDTSKVYDKTPWTGGVIDYSGFTGGDTASSLQGQIYWIGNAEGAVNVGQYLMTPTGLSSQKYDIQYHSGTLYIVPRIVDIAVTKTYDGNATFNSGFTIINNRVLAGDAVNITGSATVSSANAGLYNAFATNNLVSSNANYTANPVNTANHSYGSFGTVAATIAGSPTPTPTPTPTPAPAPTPAPTPTTTSPLTGVGSTAILAQQAFDAATVSAMAPQNASVPTLAKNLGVFIANVSGALSDGYEYWSQPNNYLNPENKTDAALMKAIQNGESLSDIYGKYKSILGNVKTFGPAAAFLFEELEALNSVIKDVNAKFQKLQDGVITDLLDAEYVKFQPNDKNSITTMVGNLAGNSITGFSDGLGNASSLIDSVFAGKAIFNKATSAYSATKNLKTKIEQAVDQLAEDSVLAGINTKKLREQMEKLAMDSFTYEKFVDGPWGQVPELLETIAKGEDPKFGTFGYGELGDALKKLKKASNGDNAKFYQDALGLILTLKSAYDSSRTLLKLTSELIKAGANLTDASISQEDQNKLTIQAMVIEKIKADNPYNWQELLSGQQVYTTDNNRWLRYDELIVATYTPPELQLRSEP